MGNHKLTNRFRCHTVFTAWHCLFDNGGDYRMLSFNSDGSVGEMCGNGARCICRYGFENGLAGEAVDENMKW